MDRLGGEAGDAVDELLAGRGVAPGCELCDPSVGTTVADAGVETTPTVSTDAPGSILDDVEL
jgi:hypothetical protein